MDDCSDGDGDGKIFVGMGRGCDKFMGTDRDSLFYVQVAAWWRAQDRQNRARNCADSDAPARSLPLMMMMMMMMMMKRIRPPLAHRCPVAAAEAGFDARDGNRTELEPNRLN